jgi:primosomal protein N' (replication factor Y)
VCRSTELARIGAGTQRLERELAAKVPELELIRLDADTASDPDELAGRSGRDAPGRVLVQSFQPDARPLALAANHDVPRFLTDELERRKELGYPPYRHLVRIVASGPDERGPAALLEELKAGLGAELLGPAPLLRLRGRHRAQLVAKTDEPRRVAAGAAQLLAAAAPAMRRAGVTAVVDVDPQSL